MIPIYTFQVFLAEENRIWKMIEEVSHTKLVLLLNMSLSFERREMVKKEHEEVAYF